MVGMDPDSSADRMRLLRLALKLDALATAPTSAAYVLVAQPLGDLFGLSPWVLRASGGFLLLFAAFAWVTATRDTISRPAVYAVIAINVVWAVGSVAAAIAGWDTPGTFGAVWIVLQGVFAAGFGALEYVGLKRA